MSEEPLPPTLAQYARQHGLMHQQFAASLPKATQLMRQGFLQEVPSLARGELPGGLANAWLAQASYAFQTRSDIERDRFTLILIQAPESLGFATRVLCHDREMSKRDAANPDADREVVELDDRKVTLESEGFLRRYALSTDHDQDQLAVWQLFDPSLIDWLTEHAPQDFGFELQDGALACFVPGFLSEAEPLDALCAAAAQVFGHISSIQRSGGTAAPAAEGSRDDTVSRELAEHPFSEPPKSTKAAARHFRHGPLLGDQAWKLGGEAFFREHARALGFEPTDLSRFRGTHLQTFVPGVLANVAAGTLPVLGVDGFLIFSNNADYEDMGWSSLVTESVAPMAAMTLAASTPRADAAKRGSIQVGANGRSLYLWTLDGGARDRSAEELNAFVASASEILGRL